MALINVTNLTFSYDGSYDNIFEDVSFQIDTNWKLGFTGRNGRGKTTFLRLLQGKYEYSGKISADVDFEYFPYEVTDMNALTTDIIAEISPECLEWQVFRELKLLEVDEEVLYRPFATLSNGEQTKALLAALFLRENSFFLIDEPTNHLDKEARKSVAAYLNRKSGYILVSHDRAFLDCCVDHILSINRNSIDVQKGNFSTWWENKQLRDSFELAENEKLKKDISRLEAAARRTEKWSDTAEQRKIGFIPSKVEKSLGRRPLEGAKAKKLMARSSAIRSRQEAAIEEKSSLLKNLEKCDDLKLSPLCFRGGCITEFKDVSLRYGEKEVCEGVSFKLETGDRVALCGRNGCGKSSILKLICGEEICYDGSIIIGSRLRISYVPQSAEGLSGRLTDYAAEYGIDESLFLAILRKLDFSRTQFDKRIETFSGGQKKKVLIARSLCEEAHLYVWDEPLNYIDVLSRIQIEKLLTEYSPTLLFVEHDSVFCEKIATASVYL